MIAAGALVPGGARVPARTLVAGMPAQSRRQLTEEEIARKHQGTLLYQELARRALATCRPADPLAKPEA
jgi:phenylacetic acid degradation protein